MWTEVCPRTISSANCLPISPSCMLSVAITRSSVFWVLGFWPDSIPVWKLNAQISKSRFNNGFLPLTPSRCLEQSRRTAETTADRADLCSAHERIREERSQVATLGTSRGPLPRMVSAERNGTTQYERV